ncbi:MAG: HAMP domain-containing sensor histidine kinase [Candidatus Obscuribacterales bacterium]|nr:HAMP domain-containing sensor histidine kinase [Candidatus Obscuribacterales bacterium]
MFSNVRWRIALWFIGLSTAVYIVPTMLSVALFYFSLNNALDNELKLLTSSFGGHAVVLQDGKPAFRDWVRTLQTEPGRTPAAIQLFDAEGNLIERWGRPGIGIPKFFRYKNEIHENGQSLRVAITSLKIDSNVVGYLQFQLPTTQRDTAVSQLAWIMTLVAPLVLIGLGFCSYLVSEKATVSIRNNNRMLRQLLADASHELNTPLSIIEAAAESQQWKMKNTDVSTVDLDLIISASERMGKIVEDLMLLSSLESPEIQAATAEVRLTEVIEPVVALFAPKFKRKGMRLTVNEIPEVLINADSSALEKLFSNLIENAWRYTDTGGETSLKFSLDGHVVRTIVEDSGIGISEESLNFIFDRFYRVDKSRSRESGGAGLGLSIVKAIVLAHHGSIEVKSKLGVGSQFIVTLPVSQKI